MNRLRKFILTTAAVLGLVLGMTIAAEARVDKRRPTSRKTTTAAKNALTFKQAHYVFLVMARQKDISFRFPADGCYARAHIMVQRMNAMGVPANKVWSFARSKQEPLHARTRNDPRGFVEWGYHVAPTLRVRLANKRVVDMVVDPSMFGQPVTVAKWAAAQKKFKNSRPPFVCKTRPGKAPVGPNGRPLGSEYWPAPAPRTGLDAHAIKVMLLYKPYEGRIAPRGVMELVAKL